MRVTLSDIVANPFANAVAVLVGAQPQRAIFHQYQVMPL
jgi:hypothetical protein